jgi:hypothetical protein
MYRRGSGARLSVMWVILTMCVPSAVEARERSVGLLHKRNDKIAGR